MAMQSGFIKRIRDIMRMDAGINGDAQRIEQMVWMLFLKVYDAKEDDWEINENDYTSIIPEECRWRNWAQADANGHAMTGEKLLDFVNNTLFPTLKELPVTPDTPVKKAIVKSTFEDANNYMKDGVYLRQVIDVIDEIEFDDVKESHAFGFVYEEILKDLQAAGSSGEFYTPRAVTDFMALMINPKLGEKMADFACGTGGFITSWLGQLSKKVKDTEDQRMLDDSIYGVEKKPFPYLLCVTNMLLHDIEVPNIYHMNSLKHNLLDYTEDDKFDVILMNPPYGGHEDKSIQGFFPDDLASSETADLFLSVIMYRLKKNGRAAVVVPDGFLFGLDNAKVAIKKKLLTEFNLHTIVRLPKTVFSPYTDIATNLLFFDNKICTKNVWYYRLDMPSDRKHFSKTKPMELKHFDNCIAWWNNRKEIILDDGPKAKEFNVEYLINECKCNLALCGYPHTEEVILDPKDTIENYNEIINNLFIEIGNAANAILSMLSDELPEHTEANLSNACRQLANVSNELPEEIKKSVLKYAIQGKLVEQKKEEGNAEEQYKLINQTIIKEDVEVPFDIPDDWKWFYLCDLTSKEIRRGKSPKYDENGTAFAFAQKCNSKYDGIKLDLALRISDASLSRYADGDEIRNNDIIINSTGTGTLGRIGFFENQFNTQDAKYYPDSHVTIIRAKENINPRYIYICLNYYQKYLESKGEGSTNQKELKPATIKELLIPLPPYEEQNRIVAKVEQILPYCI